MEISRVPRLRAKSNPQIPSARYTTLSGSNCAHKTLGIHTARGVNAISVK
jgi:hypothetical protein